MHTEADHMGSDAAATVFLRNTDMVEVTLAAVGTAKDRSDNPVSGFRHHAGGGIAQNKPFNILPGIIQCPDPKAADGHPQGPDIVIILRLHRHNVDFVD